jgi:hypothetical protein
MDTSASLKELREEDLDAVSAGKTLHFGKLHFGNLHFGKLHFGKNDVVQINTAVQIGLAIGGAGGAAVAQFIDQSNIL